MKRMLLIAAGLALSACFFAGCKSLPTAQETFANECAIVNGDLKIIGASPLLTQAQQDFVNQKVLPANQAVCAGVAQLNPNVSDLKALHDSLLPATIAIIQGIPAFPDQTIVLLALQTFGPLVQQQVDMLITAVAPVPASTVAVSK